MRAIRCRIPLTVVLISAGILIWAKPLSALDNPEVVIEETCARDWSHNAHMRAACIEQQMTVLEKARSTPTDSRLQLEDLSLIQEKCAKDWPDDIRMRVQCEQQQIRGFQKLQGPPPKGVTLTDYSIAVAHCAKESPDDFRLRARCLEQQLAEMRRDQELDNGFEPRQ